MFNGLRLRLTLLYMLVALGLLALIGGGTAQLLRSYFQQTTDLALRHKMAHEFQLLNAPLPASLASADADWSSLRGNPPSAPTDDHGGDNHRDDERKHSEDDDDDHQQAANPTPAPAVGAEDRASLAYDGELAAIFVLPLSQDGQLIFNPNPATPPIVPDLQALNAAMSQGNDLRTVQASNGPNVRLLTYRVTNQNGPAVLQLGRALDDQERILGQLTISMLALGGVSAVLLGLGSWWLAGRAIRPAQQAWEQQQTFIANASHELRTPLTLLRASAEVAQRSLPASDQDTRELLDDVLHESDHMGRLVDDLLLLSRLDGGKVSLERVAIPLPELLADVQRQVGRLADTRQIRLSVEPCPLAVWGDPTRLRQMLLILLDNALRYTPPGGTVTVRVAPTAKTGHGRGTSARFYRADQARGANNGSGLGLAIAKGLVEAQGGQISISSQPGRGTSVSLTLEAVS
ncbi:MAG: HAMP domain-containing histidine kinase [Chloroflexaceae bacterium]|nr:HAMP domain-containing histidine kinase [Chloroflexaceae bacterium]